MDGAYGIEAALLLVILPAYFIYKALVVRDVLFTATTGLLIGAAIVSYLPPINLGRGTSWPTWPSSRRHGA